LERERGGDGNHHAKLALRFLLFPRQRERETGEVGRLETRGREKKEKEKKVTTFYPINYSVLTLFLHKLSIIILDPIKLSSYDIFPTSVSQKG
jgi:hypothetical protein